MRAHVVALICLLSGIHTAEAAPTGKDPSSHAQHARADKQATVELDLGTVIGLVEDGVESFSGIPYAKAPTGQLRLKPPVRLNEPFGTFDATGPAAACPQMLVSSESADFLTETLGSIANLPFVQEATGQTEDCLSITVARPEGTKADAGLPVLFWIFGGAFQFGWSSMYDGSSLVNHGVDINEPFVFVAVNYRVNGFGFMPGKEILQDGASNLGLLDQRMGLEWVADNIVAFGGDPSKVTIWGESAGAISVADQMVLYGGDNKYKGKPLFRGAIMNSGSAAPADPIDGPRAQAVYDQVVREAGCDDDDDTLNCLRELPYTEFLDAVTSVPGFLSYSALALSYLPRPDGKVLPKSPDALFLEGSYAAVPVINGVQEDEGTLFALFQPNVTNAARLKSYLLEVAFPHAKESTIDNLIATYGNGPLSAVINGSPYRTGLRNEITPGFKRRAAVFGDIIFILSRRALLTGLKVVRPGVPSWSYLASYDHGTPILGTFHASDLLQVFYGIKDNYAARSIRTYYTNFVHNLDPNKGEGSYPNWPRWDETTKIINFEADSSKLMDDDFRSESYEIILSNLGDFYQ